MRKYTSEEFIEYMGGLTGKINVGRSLKASPLTFFDVYGTKYAATTGDGMLFNLAPFVGKETLEWKWDEPHWVKEGVEIKLSPVVEKTPEVVKKEVVVEKEIKSDKPQPDWEWVSTLENKKYDKVKLDEYAEKEFGVKLARNKSLENMIKDFKEAVEG